MFPGHTIHALILMILSSKIVISFAAVGEPATDASAAPTEPVQGAGGSGSTETTPVAGEKRPPTVPVDNVSPTKRARWVDFYIDLCKSDVLNEKTC